MGGFCMRDEQNQPPFGYGNLDVRVCLACGGSHNTNECQRAALVQAQNAQPLSSLNYRSDLPAADWFYGAQYADTDGMAKYLVSDGHEDDAPALTWDAERIASLEEREKLAVDHTVGLEARIARKEAANEALTQRVFALETKLDATLADAQSLQRKAADWEAECRRLSALLVETREELARRMALPANALRYSR